MRCERWESLLSPYLDGELSADEGDAVEEHLQSCSDCGKALASMRALSELLSSHIEPDPYFVVRFRARRRLSMAGEGVWLFWRRLAVRLLPLATAALMGAAAVVWFSTDEPRLSELEATDLDRDLTLLTEDQVNPVLRIAMEPFPEQEQ